MMVERSNKSRMTQKQENNDFFHSVHSLLFVLIIRPQPLM